MVVDDDPRSARRSWTFSGSGVVESASHGAEGLHLFSEWRPDVVLTDMFMPVMDGLELIRTIRRTSNTVGIMAMSGVWQRSGVMDQAVTLGAAATLLKPIDFNLLRETVASVARRLKK